MSASQWFQARVSAVVQETPVDRTFRIAFDDDVRLAAAPGQSFAAAPGQSFAAAPGQYVMLRIPSEEPPRERAYSLSGVLGGQRPLRITVRSAGSWGQAVYALTAGTPVEVQAPAGTFVLNSAPEDDLILIGGGSGITPFRTFVEALVDNKHGEAPNHGAVTVMQSAQQEDHVVFRAEFEAWAATHDWLTYLPFVTGPDDDPKAIERQIKQQHVADAVRDPAKTVVYACGPKGMVEALLAAGTDIGIPADRLRKESW